jgi:hypothetical protein
VIPEDAQGASRASNRRGTPKRPYRDSAILYGVLAALLVAFAYVTGGDVLRAVVFGAGFFLVATLWSWWRFRQRLAAERSRR